jgi:hypothetical protein
VSIAQLKAVFTRLVTRRRTRDIVRRQAMQPASSFVLLIGTVAACTHPTRLGRTVDEPVPPGVAAESRSSVSKAARSDAHPLTFAGRCVPNVFRLPVHADIQPGRTPNSDRLVFSRPFCIADNGTTMCHVQPTIIVDQGGPAFHGDGVGVVRVIVGDQRRLAVSLEQLDKTFPLSDAFALTEAAAVVEDGCVTIPWSTDGVGKLEAIRGDLTRSGSTAPWMFRPSPRICAAAHVPGDDLVIDVPVPVTGKATAAIPKTGLSGARITGMLRGPTGGTFAPAAFSVVANAIFPELEWRVRSPARGATPMGL